MTTPDHRITDAPHRRRDLAESFGVDAERYDRTRPRYPSALADAVLAGLPGSDVLDVGIGTGIAALPFAQAGASVLGVDVDTAMAELARRRGFDVEIGRFEDWEPAGRMFDAVVAGQTWHWIDPPAGAAKAATVLRAGGRLAVFWNVGDPPPEIAPKLADVYRTVDTGLPFTPWATSARDGYDRIAGSTTDGIRASGAFTEPTEWRTDWQQTITRDAWLDQVPTFGGHSRLAPPVLNALLDGMADVIDAGGGSFAMTYTTLAIMATRLG